LAAPRGLPTRLLLHVPEGWGKAKRRRRVHWVRHTRRVSVRSTPAFFSCTLLPAQENSAVVHRCGRWQACDCATDMCNTHAFDCTSRNVGPITYPLGDITG
jgi:hypothetical protein